MSLPPRLQWVLSSGCYFICGCMYELNAGTWSPVEKMCDVAIYKYKDDKRQSMRPKSDKQIK